MMTSFRELKAMLLGFNCADEATRRKMIELVPDLAELVDCIPEPEKARRWKLTAYSGKTETATRTVVCRKIDLELCKTDFAAQFPYATGISVDAEEIT